MAEGERAPVAYVQRRNGAWLVHFVGTHAADQPENDNFDAASSLAAAKRIAKEGARQYADRLRWVESAAHGGWILEGVEDPWEG